MIGPHSPLLPLAAVFVAVSVFSAALAVPLARRRVPPNGTYGFRVPATLADDVVWYEVNAWSGRVGVGLGIVLALLAVGLTGVRGMTEGRYVAAWAATFVGAYALVTAAGWRKARRLLDERTRVGESV